MRSRAVRLLRDRRAWLAAGAGLLVWLMVRRRNDGPTRSGGRTYAYPSYITGRRVTRAGTDAQGWVQTAPSTLAAQAGLDIETYTLARFIGSEFDSGNIVEKAAIAWAILNRARLRKWSLLKLATWVTRGGQRDSGLYGSQELGRYASTSRDPSDRDVYVATMVLSGTWPDLTSGADKFFDPETQDAMHERKPNLYKTAEQIVAKWTGDGSQVVHVAGVRERKLMLFRGA